MGEIIDYKPNFGGAAAILQAAANVIAVAEKERMLRIAEWRNALLETPPCDGETVFIGINTAGFACCFNEVTRDGVCSMAGPEITTVQMSGLKWWRVLDRPDASPLTNAPGATDAEKAAPGQATSITDEELSRRFTRCGGEGKTNG